MSPAGGGSETPRSPDEVAGHRVPFMPLLTVASFSTPEEAHLLRMRLEAGGVPAFVADEHIVQTQWLFSNAVGGVRVQIDEEDADAARAILEEPAPPELPGDRPVCPRCGSLETEPDTRPRRFSFLMLLVAGFPWFVPKHRWCCASCGERWNER